MYIFVQRRDKNISDASTLLHSMKIFYCIILLALKAQANNKPHFTLKPNAHTQAFYGESTNFTWMYSFNHPLYRGSFGLYHLAHGTITKHLLTIDNNQNSTFTTAPIVSDDTKDYHGRVRFVGDMAKKTVSIELSNIKNTDKTYYGIELEFEDDDMSVIVNATKLIVKTPSSFTASPGAQSLLRRSTASFPWKYNLNDEDKKLLKTISFGFYRQSKFNLLCFIEVTKTNCSLGKAKVVSMDVQNSITFEISQLELKDEATYAIRFEGTLRPMESRSKVIVLDPPKITGQPKTSLNLKEHETLSLNCTASGKPIPLITWYKDDQVVQANFIGIFTVNNTLKEDAGKYHCVAGNKVGSTTSLTATVDVQYSPIINTTSKFTIIHAPVGRKVQFKCSFLANPPAITSWYIKSQPHSKYNGQELEITIRNKDDYGNYTCRASNALGADQASFLLEEVGPPTQPKVDCEQEKSRSVVFRWVAPQDNGGAPVFAYTVKQRKLTSDNQHHAWINSNVSNSETWYKFPLEWQTRIELTVTAWNMYGESKLDLENTCIYTIGKDPALNTVVPTRQTTVRSVAADPALNTVVPTRQTTVRSVAAAAYDDSKDNQNTMVYVGICIALVALIAVVITFIVYRVKKNRKRKPCVPNVDAPSQQELSLLKTQPN